MKKLIKPLLVVSIMATAFSSQAIRKDITVNANVDTTIDMTQPDNTALPSSIDMQYLPGKGLSPFKLNTKVWSNSATAGVNIRLVSAATLADVNGENKIPLTVTLGDKVLTTADQMLDAATLFPVGIDNGSEVLPLRFAQATQNVVATGTYSGVVSLVITQATKAP
ncbi:fimbrial protein [Serratia sp. JSRIV001]|uniref:CS1 type fimbrial major subunit n=1 Tax=Serratia TaxID=613 RepID=UPI000BA2BAEB|nr:MULTISPECIES: CS1 type fimbrial major subunit [Serratia]PAA97349.1 fimbrial protein [Serratia fonticola]QXN63188.1 fimbrial protein [Serratia fonticola]UAN46801.1 fimbrial protein [Serratia sp. JSRIV001]UAN52408.1 fimbrial protein [Serratia sp. JSRIV002]UAN63872.1 fimbrial protein [Serratia sp. JSRIV006]